MMAVAAIASTEEGGCSDDLALLPEINRVAGVGKQCRASAAYFNKHQAVPVEHDQVDLTAAGPKVARDRAQTRIAQIAVRKLLGVVA